MTTGASTAVTDPQSTAREPSELERELRDVIVGMADTLARMMADHLGRSLGGQDVYVPAPPRATRDAAIRAFVLQGDGSRDKRIKEAASRWRVSERTVYRIVNGR